MGRLRFALFCACLAMAGVAKAQVLLKGHTDDVYFVAFLADSRTLLSGAEDHSIRTWTLGEPITPGVWQRVPEFDAAPSTKVVALSPDGRLLARAGAAQGTAEIWDVAKVARVRTLNAHARLVDGVALSRDGAIVATHSQDEMKVWALAAGTQLARLAAPNLYSFRAVAVSPDGKHVAAATSDKRVTIIDVAAARILDQFDAGPGQLHALAFSPDSSLLAIGEDSDENPSVRVWSVTRRAFEPDVRGTSKYARSVAWSADGRFLASGGIGAVVWDIRGGARTAAFSGHNGPVRSVAFSPDGKYLATGSEDNGVGLWTLPETTASPGGTK